MNKYYNGHKDYDGNGVGVVLVGPPAFNNTWKVYRDKPNTFKNFVVQAELYRSDRLYMPNPSTFTGQIAELEEFSLETDKFGKQVLGKVFAEGCEVPPGSAFAMSSADCYTVVISHPSRYLLAFHAGLKSLLDYDHVVRGSKPRKHFSVIDSAMESILRHFSKTDINIKSIMKELHISIHCGISWKYFRYPYKHKYGIKNYKLLSFIRKSITKSGAPTKDPKTGKKINRMGHIDLREIILSQLSQYGINSSQIYDDGIDTGPSEVLVPSTGDLIKNEFVSVRQKTAQSDDPKKVRRNLVMVWCLAKDKPPPRKSEYTD